MEISLHETIFPAPSACVPYLCYMWHMAVSGDEGHIMQLIVCPF